MAILGRWPPSLKLSSSSAPTHSNSYLTTSMTRIRSHLSLLLRPNLSGASIWKWNLTALTGKCLKVGLNKRSCNLSPPKRPYKPPLLEKTRTLCRAQTLSHKLKVGNRCQNLRRIIIRLLLQDLLVNVTPRHFMIGKPSMNKFWKSSLLITLATIISIGAS